jgi:hypothetical protein
MDELTPEHREALDVARRLIQAGVPVFAAAPDPDHPGRYILPKHWEKTVPAEVWLDPDNPRGWKPGWALAAVGGHAVDFLDVDPRNGGQASLEEVVAAGHMPHVFGRAKTPSGGDHFIIAPTGERKSTGFMPGLDLQSGAPDGVGRGFVYIAPTVRPSKDPADNGALKPYRWELPPLDLKEELEEYGPSAIDSTEGIVSRVQAKRAAPRERLAEPIDPDDPFMTNDVSGAHGGDRSFTLAEAQEFVRPYLMDLQAAQVGSIEEHANTAATVLSHFVPEFWSVDQAMGLLEVSLSQTAYDPNGPSDWTVEKFRAVLDGRRPPLDAWKATKKLEPPAPPPVTVEAEPGEENLSTLEKLKRKLVTATELANMPAPTPLVYDLLDLDSEAWMIGAPGSLKSFVALDIAGHVGRGMEWQGHRVRKAPVLYIAAEGTAGMVLRARAWEKINGAMDGVVFLPYPVKVKSQDGQWEAVVEIAREYARQGLVVIDTQARVSTGLEENSATDMGILVDAIGKLKRVTGACVLTIHHTGRNGGDARGSSALDGAQDTELKVVRDLPRSALTCRVLQDKQKDMAEGQDEGVRLHMNVVDLGTDPETGRALSSLVVGERDPFLDGQVPELDRRQPWLPSFGERDTWRRRILDTLYTFAPEGHGLTKADLDRTLKEHFPGYDPRAGGPKKAWKDLLELRDPQGDAVVEKITGERYGVVSLPVRAALAEELGDRAEGIALPGLPAVEE